MSYDLSGQEPKALDPIWWKGKWERKFLGKIKDFSSPEERKLEGKHLKAYIKGHKYYKDGTYREIFNPLTGLYERHPNLIEVKQSLTKIK